ncbi:MAG: hypothetical protein S4CHLAM81_07920 [Chlamydiales bacterium]|nr:hypothetical protein [Chlamydiales bacterium]MCH9635574.1 hypothetical protein [Chlamydiales bacterium]
MSLTGALLAIGVIFFSVLLHEFGHALTAAAFGQKTRIELAAFGGFTYREGSKLKLWKEFIVVLNGPIVGFLIFLTAYFFSNSLTIENPLLAFMLKFTYIANFFWTVINLIPVMPLDGGHLLSIVMEGIFGFKGIKAAIVIGLAISIIISVTFFALGMFLVGALFLILTFESFRSLRYYRIFKEQDRNSDLQELMREAELDLQSGNKQVAIEKLEKIRATNKEGILYTLATQEIAEIYSKEERYDEAYNLLLPIYKRLSGENLSSFQFLAHMNGDYEMVTRIGNKCYQENPTYNTALLNAIAYAAQEKAEPAVGWLDCAKREGLPSLKEALEHPEFDLIKDDPKFKKFRRH